MLCLARLIRWAMVASGTRNARAISAVVKPPTARNVSAIAEAGLNAGWQHINRRTNVSSSCGEVSTVRRFFCVGYLQGHLALAMAATPIRCEYDRPSAGTRPASAMRGDCPVGPRVGHCIAAASDASWTASSAAAKSRNLRTTVPSTCGVNSRNRCSIGTLKVLACHCSASAGPLITCRTSMGWLPRDFIPGPRRQPARRADTPVRGFRRQRSRIRRGIPWLPGRLHR